MLNKIYKKNKNKKKIFNKLNFLNFLKINYFENKINIQLKIYIFLDLFIEMI